MTARIALVTFIALLVPSIAQAQQVSLGPRAQVGFVTLNSDDNASDDGIDGVAGFGFGGQVIYAINDTYGFQAELGWVRRGAATSLRLFEIQGATTSIDTDVTLDYLELPILFRIHHTVSGQSFTPKILLGPYVAGYINGKARGEAFGLSAESDLEPGDDVDPLDLGVVLGLGGDFALGSNAALTLDFRAQTGLVGIEAEDGDASLFNVAFTLNLGVVFGVIR